ncbi:Predicted membrane protein [Nocardia cyriacigeorgica]|uniref:Predicted membrane protein n=2 Tax=Nocardia cyriacigeorgica TaxID=135487 RepID=A0A4U8W1Y6_9NOCA|nr:Predicted membrane protein [Nocardia cyriacigeorgica]
MEGMHNAPGDTAVLGDRSSEAAGTQPTMPSSFTSFTDDASKRRDLWKMKSLATGLLAVATAIYLGCRWLESRGGGGDWVGYVRAASEAGMVGALADWFAVTALFRHPLGLPIPHTAIIKRKKDQLGASLGSFVGTNFLSPEVVTAKVNSAQVSWRVGRWMADPANAARVAQESSTILRAVVGVLRDEDVEQVIDNTIVKRIAEPQWGPPIGRVLAELLADNRQLPLLDLLAERAHQWALGSQETIDRVVLRDAPQWAPKFVNIMLSEKIYREVVEFTWKVRSTPDHEVRLAANRFLEQFADDLQHDEAMIAKAERIKSQIMGREEITGMAEATWRAAKRLILESADDPNSTLRRKVAENVQALGEQLRDDEITRGKVDGWIERGARYLAANYADEIATIVSDTVARWDAEEASKKIELQVGRDLQFIRINGTVVGSLAGLAIYTVSHLMFGG